MNHSPVQAGKWIFPLKSETATNKELTRMCFPHSKKRFFSVEPFFVRFGWIKICIPVFCVWLLLYASLFILHIRAIKFAFWQGHCHKEWSLEYFRNIPSSGEALRERNNCPTTSFTFFVLRFKIRRGFKQIASLKQPSSAPTISLGAKCGQTTCLPSSG